MRKTILKEGVLSGSSEVQNLNFSYFFRSPWKDNKDTHWYLGVIVRGPLDIFKGENPDAMTGGGGRGDKKVISYTGICHTCLPSFRPCLSYKYNVMQIILKHTYKLNSPPSRWKYILSLNDLILILTAFISKPKSRKKDFKVIQVTMNEKWQNETMHWNECF